MFKKILSEDITPPFHVDFLPTSQTAPIPDVLPSVHDNPISPEAPILSATEKLTQFLTENHIRLTPSVMTEQCIIVPGGIVVNEKPLLKIDVEYRK
jgi:hypothetical protein